MIALVLAASFGVYHWHQRREEKLKSHVAFALIKIAYGVNWVRKDCEEPEQYDHIRRRVWLQKLELGWIDLQCRGETDRARPATSQMTLATTWTKSLNSTRTPQITSSTSLVGQG